MTPKVVVSTQVVEYAKQYGMCSARLWYMCVRVYVYVYVRVCMYVYVSLISSVLYMCSCIMQVHWCWRWSTGSMVTLNPSVTSPQST